MRRISHAALFLSLLAWATGVPAGAAPPQPPTIVLLLQPAGAPADPVRDRLAAALRDGGAFVAAPERVHAAAEGMAVKPEDLSRSREAREVSRQLHADAVVQVQVHEDAGQYTALVRVVGSDGLPRLHVTVPWHGPVPSKDDASAVASAALQGVALPASQARTAEPAPNVDAEQIPNQPTEPFPLPPVIPNPKPLRLTDLSAWPTITWRSFTSRMAQPSTNRGFATSTPYFGLTLHADSFPFLKGAARYIGFGAEYSFSALSAGALGETPVANAQPLSMVATEQRFTGDIIGVIPPRLLGGRLALHLGVAYEGFFIPQGLPQVTTTYVSPRVMAEYWHPLPAGLALDFQAGVRPFAGVGGAQIATYGHPSLSIGFDAQAGLSGPFSSLLPQLRWMVGYNFLYYLTDYGPATAQSRTQEMYNRAFLGVTFRF